MVLLALAAAQGRGSDMAGSMGQGGAGTMASQHAAGVTPDQSGDTARQDAAIDAMSSMHMSDGMAGHSAMSEHMAWSDTRLATDADRERAREIVKTLQTALAKYKDYHVAEADGFRPFHPELRQDIYHFTRWQNGLKAAFTFDPAEPTSLLYKKTSHDGYALVGAMYTAPRGISEAKLESARAARSCAMASARQPLLPAQGTARDRRLDEVRRQRLDCDQGGVRRGRRTVLSAGLRMDGARLSVGDDAGSRLVALSKITCAPRPDARPSTKSVSAGRLVSIRH